MTNPPHRYGHVAWCYDALASAYSLGAIHRAKALHHDWIKSADKLLYAGAGAGREIVGACERGAQVACIEPCNAMASRLRNRLAAFAHSVAIDSRPIQAIDPQPTYDCVVAHFFLNLFDPAAMPGILDRLAGFVRPGGRLVIADFKPAEPQAGVIDRALRALYYRPLNRAGRSLGICDLHPVYDYTPMLAERGFAIESRQGIRILPGLPMWYEVLVARAGA